jgi:hypothetical protein
MPIVRTRRTEYGQKRPGRNAYLGQYPLGWNNELSGSKRNIRHGEPVGLNTSSISPVPGEPFIESSRNTGFSFMLRQSPNPPGSGFKAVLSTACGSGDTFQFRIRGVGKVYVTDFADDCSQYRVKSKVYLHKDASSAVNALRWALRTGWIPRKIYLYNGKPFVSKAFKTESQKNGINLIFG